MSATGCSHQPINLDGHDHWDNLHRPHNDLYYPRSQLLHNIDPMSTTDGTDERHFSTGEIFIDRISISRRNSDGK